MMILSHTAAATRPVAWYATRLAMRAPCAKPVGALPNACTLCAMPLMVRARHTASKSLASGTPSPSAPEGKARRSNRHGDFDSIPTVNVSDLFSPSLAERQRVAEELGAVAERVGFAYISGHGIAPSLIRGIQEAARDFYALPEAKRMETYIGRSFPGHKGYQPRDEFSAPDRPTAGDIKEAFDVGFDIPETHPLVQAQTPLLGHNLWPSEADAPLFRQRIMDYYNAVFHLGHRLWQALGMSLGLPQNALDHMCSQGAPPASLRLLHYPVQADYDPGMADLGMQAHSDFECLTLLLSEQAGLEVLNGRGQWIDAPPREGTLVLNIGDMTELLSGGKYIATRHRVRPMGKEERYSFPLFWAPDYHTKIQPLNPPSDPELQRKYRPLIVGDHIWAQTMPTIGYLQDKINSGEVALPRGSQVADNFGPREADPSGTSSA